MFDTYMDAPRSAVDLIHDFDLVIPFHQILLVDTDGINPKLVGYLLGT